MGKILALKWVAIAAGVVIAGMLGWALRLEHLRASWQDVAQAWADQAATVVVALQQASGNPKVTWETATGQVIALGESNRALKQDIGEQSERVDAMAAEAVRLKATAGELKKIADRAEAQRQSALRRLSDQAITPGTRTDCLQLLREAEDALDLVYEEGA